MMHLLVSLNHVLGTCLAVLTHRRTRFTGQGAEYKAVSILANLQQPPTR